MKHLIKEQRVSSNDSLADGQAAASTDESVVWAALANAGAVVLLHLPLALLGVSTGIERESVSRITAPGIS